MKCLQNKTQPITPPLLKRSQRKPQNVDVSIVSDNWSPSRRISLLVNQLVFSHSPLCEVLPHLFVCHMPEGIGEGPRLGLVLGSPGPLSERQSLRVKRGGQCYLCLVFRLHFSLGFFMRKTFTRKCLDVSLKSYLFLHSISYGLASLTGTWLSPCSSAWCLPCLHSLSHHRSPTLGQKKGCSIDKRRQNQFFFFAFVVWDDQVLTEIKLASFYRTFKN